MADIDMDYTKLPEVLDEFIRYFNSFKSNVEQYDLSKEKIASWNSPSKRALEEEMKNSMPKFEELLSVLNSYINVGHSSAEELMATENNLMKNFMG